MRKKTYAVQAPESVYKILTELSETMNISKSKALEIVVQFFVDNHKAAKEVVLKPSKSEKQVYTLSPLRVFKDAN
jgi:hypothetical protein